MNPLQQLSDDIAQFLLADPALSRVPVVNIRRLLVESEVDAASKIFSERNGGSGTAVLVLMPSIDGRYPNVPGPQLRLSITLRVMEQPTLNNSGLSAEDIGLEILRWLDGFADVPITYLTLPEGRPALAPNYDYEGILVYDVELTGPLPRTSLARVAVPAIVESLGEVTLSCATPGAAIYYTLDGQSFPAPTNGSAVLYQAPFAADPGTVVRYAAFADNLLPSQVSQATIT